MTSILLLSQVLLSAMGPATFNDEVVFFYIFLVVMFLSLAYTRNIFRFFMSKIKEMHVISYLKKQFNGIIHPHQ